MQIKAKDIVEGLKLLKDFTQTDAVGEPYDIDDEDDYTEEPSYGDSLSFDDGSDMSPIVIGESEYTEQYDRRYDGVEHGGLMDEARKMVNGVVRRGVNSVTGHINREIKRVDGRVTGNRKAIQGNYQQVRLLRKQLRNQTKRSKKVIGKMTKNMWLNAGAAGLSSLPGLKAHAILFGDTFRNERAAQRDFDEVFEGLTIPSAFSSTTLTPQPGTPTGASVDASFTAVQADIAELQTTINYLYAELAKAKSAAETHVAAVEKLDKALVRNTLVELCRLLPNAFDGQYQALVQMAIRFLFGGEDDGSGTSLNINLG